MVLVAETVRWHTVLAGWRTDPISVVGLCAEISVAIAYVLGAAAVSRRRRPWSAHATAAFLGGLAVTAIALQSGFAAYDDTFWVHVVQHVVLMSVAPVLIALGAPVTLCLQLLPTPGARRLVATLHSRVVRALCGRPAAAHVAVDYYGLMFVYLLTPAVGLSTRNEAFHVGVHAVFFLCGLLFWVPVVGADPTGWRPARRTKVAMLAAGVPVNAVLALAVRSWSVLAATEMAALLGLLLMLGRERRTHLRRATVAVSRPRAVSSAPAVQS